MFLLLQIIDLNLGLYINIYRAQTWQSFKYFVDESLHGSCRDVFPCFVKKKGAGILQQIGDY